MLKGGEDRGEVLDKGFDSFRGAGGVIGVIDGKVSLKDSMVRGKGVAEVHVVVRLAVSPVDEGNG